jgi:thiamine biosynthesis lipoprotein
MKMEIVQFRAMNTDVFLAAEGKLERLAEGFEKAQQYILDSERRFTRFSEDSELSQLNRAGGTWFHASPDMVSVLLLAQHFVGLTHGLFDPSIFRICNGWVTTAAWTSCDLKRHFF